MSTEKSEQAEAAKAPIAEKAEAHEAAAKLLQCATTYNYKDGSSYSSVLAAGVFHASKGSGGDKIQTDLLKGRTLYEDTFENGMHHLGKRAAGPSSNKPFTPIVEGSKEFDKILTEMKQIDFQKPACAPKDYGPVPWEPKSDDDFDKAIKEIREEKQPLVKMTYEHQTHIYENGQLVAFQFDLPHTKESWDSDGKFASTRLMYGTGLPNDPNWPEKAYEITQDLKGKEHVEFLVNANPIDWSLPVRDGSSEYNQVIGRLHKLDIDHIPLFQPKVKQ